MAKTPKTPKIPARLVAAANRSTVKQRVADQRSGRDLLTQIEREATARANKNWP